MEYIEDYEEQCKDHTKNVERLLKSWKMASNADKPGIVESIKHGIKQLREVCTLYKSDLYLVPRAQELEFRGRYDAYIEKIGKYETAVKKMDLILKGDRKALMDLKSGADPERFAKLNSETQRLASHGFKV